MQWNLQRSWRDKKPFLRVMSLADCKDGTSAGPPDLRAPLYMEDGVRIGRGWQGIWAATAMATKSAPLPAPQLCPLTSEFWAPFLFPLCISAICTDLSGSSGFLLKIFRTTSLCLPRKPQLYLFIESNPILNISTKNRHTDYLFFLCHSLWVSKELGWRRI